MKGMTLGKEKSLADVHWDEKGLVPAVVQDARTGQVLMLAYMNAAALARTLETSETWFWSRSRRELWHKGATSGNTQRLAELRYDCDADALLLRVEPRGPACHTGEMSCFYRQARVWKAPSETAPGQVRDLTLHAIDALERVIADRKANPKEGSYTCRLFAAGEPEILKKIGEEAVEVIVAAQNEGNERLVSELADLAYHTLVLLAARDLTWADVEAELARRFGK